MLMLNESKVEVAITQNQQQITTKAIYEFLQNSKGYDGKLNFEDSFKDEKELNEKCPQKQKETYFLCRDWHTAIVKVCIVKGREKANKVANILEDIHNTFHYKFEASHGEHLKEWERDIRLKALFDELNSIDGVEMSDGDFGCDVWGSANGGYNYHDAYWGF